MVFANRPKGGKERGWPFLLSAFLSISLTLTPITICQGAYIKGEPIMAVDLGTTFSSVAIAVNGQVEVLQNRQGSRTTPSIVAFNEKERLVGQGAANQQDSNPTNTVYCAKRLIGRKFDEPAVQDLLGLFTYPIVMGRRGSCAAKVSWKGRERSLAPEQVASMILSDQKKIASARLGQEVKYAIITVPAYFTDAQRQATKDAGTIAGLEVVRIVNEPTAAALAYSQQQLGGLNKKKLTMAVLDFGGGTFDASLLKVDGTKYTVLATNGNSSLGCVDLDNNLVRRSLVVLKQKYKREINPSSEADQRALSRLRRACSDAKDRLSYEDSVQIEVEMWRDFYFKTKITRANFIKLNRELLRSTLDPVRAVLRDANLEKEEVDRVVLVGGCTRIPELKRLVQEEFGRVPDTKVKPEEAIALGAGVLAGVMSGQGLQATLVDVVPFTLGIEVKDRGDGVTMSAMIPRNHIIPYTAKNHVSTAKPYQTEAPITVYEGESSKAAENRLLGSFELKGLPKRKELVVMPVEFNVDADGIMTVTASNKEAGVKEGIRIENNRGALSQSDIDEMRGEEREYAELGRKAREDVLKRGLGAVLDGLPLSSVEVLRVNYAVINLFEPMFENFTLTHEAELKEKVEQGKEFAKEEGKRAKEAAEKIAKQELQQAAKKAAAKAEKARADCQEARNRAKKEHEKEIERLAKEAAEDCEKELNRTKADSEKELNLAQDRFEKELKSARQSEWAAEREIESCKAACRTELKKSEEACKQKLAWAEEYDDKVLSRKLREAITELDLAKEELRLERERAEECQRVAQVEVESISIKPLYAVKLVFYGVLLGIIMMVVLACMWCRPVGPRAAPPGTPGGGGGGPGPGPSDSDSDSDGGSDGEGGPSSSKKSLSEGQGMGSSTARRRTPAPGDVVGG